MTCTIVVNNVALRMHQNMVFHIRAIENKWKACGIVYIWLQYTVYMVFKNAVVIGQLWHYGHGDGVKFN